MQDGMSSRLSGGGARICAMFDPLSEETCAFACPAIIALAPCERLRLRRKKPIRQVSPPPLPVVQAARI